MYDDGPTTETATVQCDCGRVTGTRCAWSGPPSETVLVEWMPDYLRASHEAAGNSGSYPHNGAERIRMERSCAESIIADSDGWAATVVGHSDEETEVLP